MPNQELEKYIQQARQAGKSDEEIHQELWLKGSTQGEIDKLLGTKKFSTNYFPLPIIISFLIFGLTIFTIYKALESLSRIGSF